MASVRNLNFGAALVIILTLYLTDQASAATCPGYYTAIYGGCFLFDKEERDWDSAAAYCRDNDGTLAVIKDGNLYGALLDNIESHVGFSTKSVWIDGSDAATEGLWLWKTGERMNMGSLFWGGENSGEPNGADQENCLCLYSVDRYRFHDCQCSKKFTSICQTEPLF